MWGSFLDGIVKNRLGSNLQQSLVDAMGFLTFWEGCILDGELDLDLTVQSHASDSRLTVAVDHSRLSSSP